MRRLGWRLRRGGCILLYHRVEDVPSDPQLLSVTPHHFAEHVEVLREHFRPTALSAIVSGVGQRRDTGRVAVTFDDGYADNLHNAKGLLESADVPATFFVVTGSVTSGREFWWDELERIVLDSRTLPEALELKVGGRVHRWELGQDARADGGDSSASWNVLDLGEPTPRQLVYRQLHELVRPLGRSERDETLEALRAWAQAPSKTRPTHRPLSASEVAQLAGGNLLSVGAHTVSHPLLASRPVREQRNEIVASKSTLEELTSTRVNAFSYPYGGFGDYTAESVSVVRSAGFELACANFPAVLSWRSKRYELPRFLVRDWDGDEFLRRLSDWGARREARRTLPHRSVRPIGTAR